MSAAFELLPALAGSSPTDLPDCLTIGGQTLSSADLLGRADALARAIVGADAVAVHASPTLGTVTATIAGLLAAVPIIPIPVDSGADEVRYIVEDSGAEMVLGGDVPWPSAPRLGVPIVPTRMLRGNAPLPAEIGPEQTGLIIYTSGTTGRPKGVVISQGAIAAGLDGLAEAWAWTPEDTLVHGLPLFHVHGLVLGVLGPLRVGSPVVHTGQPTPDAYASAAGSLYFGVPTVWTRIARDPSACNALRSARLIVSGSAALPVSVFESLQQQTGLAPVERYGMTETLITLSTRVDGERRPGWVGTPISGVEARLVDDDGTPTVADGQTPGHLRIRGATMFDGYLGRPEATAAVLDAEGWLATGDVALTDETGAYRIVGRASTDLISSGGYRIGAGEVEDVLLNHPAVREIAVVGRPHPELGEQVVAYVVADQVPADDLIAFAAAGLSRHKCPREVRFVPELPRNAMGKVVKSELP